MPPHFLEDYEDNNAQLLYNGYDLSWSTLENSWNTTVTLSTVSAFFLSRMVLKTELM